jgi:hypothetical protein
MKSQTETITNRLGRRILWPLMATVITLGGAAASAADHGQVPPDIPDNIRAWFKSVRSSNGVPCCDIADGHRTAWRGTPSGGYEVPVDGDWIPVPPEAVILNAGNPVGEAIVWYVRTRNDPTAPDPHRDYYVRCFVPGNGA